jgi:poly(hydroxyalkanoate) depolymerase family esterase
MARSVPKVRLLRSLTRAAKLQQSLAVKLWDAFTPVPPRPPRKAPANRVAAPAAQPSIRRAAPPGLPSASGTWLALQHPLPLKPGQDMSYWLYLPERVPDTVARHGWPLIVMLHGCQQSATQFAQGTRMNRLAEEKGYAILYPQQLASVHAQRCWRWYDRATQEGEGDTAVLAALTAAVCGQHGIDRRRIYACGISAGAGMAAVLALNHPELIAAVGLHSAPVFGAGHSPIGALHVMRHGALAQADAAIAGVLQRRSDVAGPMPSMPAIMFQGDDDQVVRAVNQQQLARQWLRLNGLPLVRRRASR